jgi:hemerythrin-like domain-containing protein
MCGHCGCEALDAVAELTAEHDVVVNLAGEARRALAAGEHDLAAARARSIAAVLGPHTAVEEGALFPALSDDFGEHVAGLLTDHRLIEAVLAESAAGLPADPQWPGRLEHALWVLREHILKEQDGLFPAALATLGPASWEAVQGVRDDVGSQLRAQT